MVERSIEGQIFSEVNFSNHTGLLRKRQLKKYIILSSNLQWFLLETCVTTIKVGNADFPLISLILPYFAHVVEWVSLF